MYGEWESEIDDQAAGIESLIQSQRLLIDQRLKGKKIEAEMAALIDDRIKKLKAEYAQVTLLIDEQSKGISKLANLYELYAKVKLEDAEEALRINNLIRDQRKLLLEVGTTLGENTVVTGKLRDNLDAAAKSLQDATTADEVIKAGKEFEELKAQIQDVEEFGDNAQRQINSLAASLGMAGSAAQNKTLGPMVRLFAQLTQNADTFGSKLRQIGAGLGTMLGPLNLAVTFFGKLIDLMMGLDKAQANVAKSTGFMRDQFDDLINTNLTAENKSLGISTKELEQSTLGVLKTMGTMSQVNKKAAASLVDLGAKMAKLGGTAAGTAKAVQKLNFLAGGGLVKGLDSAAKSFESTVHKGRQLGLTTAEMETGIAQFGGAIAGMGGDVGDEFLTMATMAKNAGVEIGKLMTITKKFQTFKDGADKAAELNSILGTSISSIEMMGKTGGERLEILRQSINASTGGFSAMDRFTQLAAAEIMGFGENVDDLAGFLNTGLHPAQERIRKQQESEAQIQAAQRKAILDTATAMQKLTQTLDSLMQTFMPILTLFDAFQATVVFATEAVHYLMFGTDGVATALRVAAFAMGAMMAVNKLAAIGYGVSTMAVTELTIAERFQAAGSAIATKFTAIKSAITASSIGPTLGAAAANMTLGGAIRFMLGPVGLLIMALGGLAAAYAFKINPGLWEIAGVMAFGVIALGIAFKVMGIQGKLAAVALALLAASVALIFFGIGYVVDKFKELIIAVPTLAMQLPMMVGAFVQMVTAIGALGIQMGLTAIMIGAALGLVALGFYAAGTAGAAASLGIMVGFLALVALASVLALAGSSIGELTQLGEGVLKVGQGIAAFATGLATMTGAVAGLMAATGGNKALFVKSTSEGTTMIAGKTGGFFVIPPNIKVDVNMPDTEMKTDVTVNVFIDGEEFRGMIHQEVIER